MIMNPPYRVITAVDTVDLLPRANRLVLICWPEFMRHDPWAGKHWTALYEKFPAFQFGLAITDENELIAVGNSIPLAWDGHPEELPDEGWDWALQRGVADCLAGKMPRVLCALQIMVVPSHRGQGLSTRMVQTMKSIGAAHGLRALVAPVRPSLKARYPLIPLDRYVRWRNKDGLPFDPWMRVHARLGAEIIKTCPQSMRISASIGRWEEWTHMSFPDDGQYTIPGALVPVDIDHATDRGTYVEPNVWMRHPIQ